MEVRSGGGDRGGGGGGRGGGVEVGVEVGMRGKGRAGEARAHLHSEA